MSKPALVIACAVASALAACAGAAGVASAFAPPPGAHIARAADGHYWAEASVEGRALPMLVDTGAAAVALTPADARALGFDPAHLAYDRPVATAAGRTRAASVTLSRLSVGGVEVEAVPALVVREGLERSLLGMSYLGRLKRFSADAQGLTLVR